MNAWHGEMADALRALDPYRHLISNEPRERQRERRLLVAPRDRLHAGAHLLVPAARRPAERRRAAAPRAPQAQAKPTLLGEYGVDYRGPAETLENDPTAIGFHQGLWIGLVGGGFGCGPLLVVGQRRRPRELLLPLRPVASSWTGVAFDAQGFVPIRPASRPPAATSRRTRCAARPRCSRGSRTSTTSGTSTRCRARPDAGREARRSRSTASPTARGRARWIDTYTAPDVATAPGHGRGRERRRSRCRPSRRTWRCGWSGRPDG
jgi:hypothetical protein